MIWNYMELNYLINWYINSSIFSAISYILVLIYKLKPLKSFYERKWPCYPVLVKHTVSHAEWVHFLFCNKLYRRNWNLENLLDSSSTKANQFTRLTPTLPLLYTYCSLSNKIHGDLEADCKCKEALRPESRKSCK